jgi:hypothetical protein
MEQKKRAWLYCRIDAPEDAHGMLKGQKKDSMTMRIRWDSSLLAVPRIWEAV